MLRTYDRALTKERKQLEKMDAKAPEDDLKMAEQGWKLNVDDGQKDEDGDGGSKEGSFDKVDDNQDVKDRLIGPKIEDTLDREGGEKLEQKEIEKKIKETADKRETCQKRLDRANSGARRLETKITLLEEKRKDAENKEETDDEDDRQIKEDLRLQEWQRQRDMKDDLRALQRQLQDVKFRTAMWGYESRRPWAADSSSDESELGETRESIEQARFERAEKTLEDANTLESMITSLRWKRDEVDRKRDLRIVLGWERYLEDKWLRQAGKQPMAKTAGSLTEEKDHLSGNPLEDSDIYKRLSINEVRLLFLMPAPKDCPEYPLICSLQTQRWDTAPEYAALSYYWGPDSENGRLYLLRDELSGKLDEADWGVTARGTIRIPIRDNLFRALLRLRKSDGPVALWVDYLCINQSDKEEKTEQLDNMVKIYHKAKNVCIWLGEGDDRGRSDNAMSFIPTIMDFAMLDRYSKDKQQAENWYALAELMRDRWFSRRWVVQEMSLAQEATVHCGGKTVYWSEFADAVSLLASNQETIKLLFDYSRWREGPNTLGDVQSFGACILLEATSKLFLRDARGGIRMPRTNIESLVTSLTTFDTSDRRDLIYSVVSIARDTTRNSGIFSGGKTGPRPLMVDYKRTPKEVFMDFTKFCIRSSGSLGIICRPWAMEIVQDKSKDENDSHADGRESLPSWIPLLSNSEYGAPAEVYSGRKNGVSLVGPASHPPRYAASGKHKCTSVRNQVVHETDAVGTDDGQSIFLRGFKLARVEEVSARNTGGVILKESLELGSWAGIQTHNRVPEKIWRTLVADRDPEGQIPPTWYQRACMRCLEIADTFNNGDLNVGELLQGHSEMLRKYLTRVRNVTWNRAFFKAAMSSNLEVTNRRAEHIHNLDDRDGGIEQPTGAVVDNARDTTEIEAGEKADAEREAANVDRESADVQDSGPLGGDGDENDGVSEDADNENQDVSRQNEVKAHDSLLSTSGVQIEYNGAPTNSTEEYSNLPDRTDMSELDEANRNDIHNSDETLDEEDLFGLGPALTEQGDFVCILYGCSVPVILRQLSPKDVYILIGEAYVHGKMDGEAIPDHKHGRTWGEEEIFELQ